MDTPRGGAFGLKRAILGLVADSSLAMVVTEMVTSETSEIKCIAQLLLCFFEVTESLKNLFVIFTFVNIYTAALWRLV